MKFPAIKAIPKIVCDAITNLELTDKEPSWKIMDEKGNVTVVLNWDQSKGGETGELHEPSSWRVEVVTSPPSMKKAQLSSVKTSSNHAASSSRANLLFQDVGPRPTMIRTLPFGISVDEVDEEYEKIDNIFSPNHEQDNSQCDFHCAALHRGGGQIIVSKNLFYTYYYIYFYTYYYVILFCF